MGHFKFILYCSLIILQFAIVLVLMSTVGLFFVFSYTKFARVIAHYCNLGFVLLAKIIYGIRIEIRGKSRIKKGCYIYASKHQSPLETFFLVGTIQNSSVVYKKQLGYIPVFGWVLFFSGMVPIDREVGGRSIKNMLRSMIKLKEKNFPIVLFPEGTRRGVGVAAQYKNGVYTIYKKLNVPVIPVAHNFGVFWPNHNVVKSSGVGVIEFLEEIPAGLAKQEFMALMISRIEAKTRELESEGIKQLENKNQGINS